MAIDVALAARLVAASCNLSEESHFPFLQQQRENTAASIEAELGTTRFAAITGTVGPVSSTTDLLPLLEAASAALTRLGAAAASDGHRPTG
jgi:hypothetical protein